jgi:hypothetical protein
MNRKVLQLRNFSNSAELYEASLFDPQNKIIGQEDDLGTRLLAVGLNIGLATRSFIYHYQGKTVQTEDNLRLHQGKDPRENLLRYQNAETT